MAPFVTLLAALLLLAIAAPPADAAKRPLRTGVSYLYITDADPVAFENVKKAGGGMVLTPLEWGWVGPRNRPA
ncbi:MAG TPA: hypothetical protein VFU04_06350, partial [Solirubrobacterales bacterium]|nr:hypothetical protein [Solirubrobacterales bacterium]